MKPPDAARAVAEQMAIALLEAEVGAFSLNGSQAVWVNPSAEAIAT
jgi:hypothetical protein